MGQAVLKSSSGFGDFFITKKRKRDFGKSKYEDQMNV